MNFIDLDLGYQSKGTCKAISSMSFGEMQIVLTTYKRSLQEAQDILRQLPQVENEGFDTFLHNTKWQLENMLAKIEINYFDLQHLSVSKDKQSADVVHLDTYLR